MSEESGTRGDEESSWDTWRRRIRDDVETKNQWRQVVK